MSANRKLRVGMIGVGHFGAVRHRALVNTGLYEIVSAYDRSPEALERCRRDFGTPAAASYEQLLDTRGLEAVFICTGAMHHADHAAAAAQRGLHCFIEKPVASTLDEIMQLRQTQRDTDVIMACGHHDHGSDSISQQVLGLIESGEMGRIVAFQATSAHSGGFHIHRGDWRGEPEHNPGGMLFQCGVHKFHELNFFLGPVKRVTAQMRCDLHTTRTADVVACLVETESGVLGTVNAYHITPNHNSLALFGTRAAYHKLERPWGDGGHWLQTVPENLDGSVEPRTPLKPGSGHQRYGNLVSFYHAVRDGTAPSPSLDDGMMALLPVLAAERSARIGRPVEVAELLGPAIETDPVSIGKWLERAEAVAPGQAEAGRRRSSPA